MLRHYKTQLKEKLRRITERAIEENDVSSRHDKQIIGQSLVLVVSMASGTAFHAALFKSLVKL